MPQPPSHTRGTYVFFPPLASLAVKPLQSQLVSAANWSLFGIVPFVRLMPLPDGGGARSAAVADGTETKNASLQS